jgi:hypothetical protein
MDNPIPMKCPMNWKRLSLTLNALKIDRHPPNAELLWSNTFTAGGRFTH